MPFQHLLRNSEFLDNSETCFLTTGSDGWHSDEQNGFGTLS